MNRLEGCTIEPLNPETCRAVLEWVAGGPTPAGFDRCLIWLLAHCRDGVTWGRRENLSWPLSATPFPDLCPAVSADNLLEMRLFGKREEIMIWRSEEEFLGRRLVDEPQQSEDSPLRPHDETRILSGDRLLEGPKDGFSRVKTAAGTQQAVPLECTESDFKDGWWPLRLSVRHYFEQEPHTGAVRVAASRLVHLFKEVR